MFDDNGLLPNGIHDCSLEEIQIGLTWNAHRINLFQQFNSFLSVEIRPQFNLPIYFDGSFVTNKDNPEDTDVVLDLQNSNAIEMFNGLIFMRDHQDRLKQEYNVHFWVNLPGNSDFCEFFQYVGVKTAKVKGLDPKHKKGILRILQ